MSLAADPPGPVADELWMRKALAIARRAAARGEVDGWRTVTTTRAACVTTGDNADG